MKWKLSGVALGIGLLMACGPTLAAGELHIFNWRNYTNPELIERFSKAFDIEVTVDNYDSNDAMLAKVKAGSSGYDIVVPADYMVQVMIGEELLMQTDPSKMENFKHMRPEFIDVYWDRGRSYTVPWQWGTTGISVNTNHYNGTLDSWSVLFDPPEALKGKINMVSEMNDVIAAGLFYLGYEQCNGNEVELRALNDMLQSAKAHWHTIEYGIIEKLTSGDVYASQNWNGASMRARQQIPEVVYVYPKEGLVGWMDNVAVLADAPNPGNAKLFQNYVMAPENAALISQFARYANGIAGSEAHMDAELTTAPEIVPPAGSPTPTYIPPCPREISQLYTKIWNNLLK